MLATGCTGREEEEGETRRGGDGGKEAPSRMKGNRKKRVFPSGGSLYSSSSPLGRARPSRRKKRNGQRADPCRGADCLGPRERAHPAYETVNLTIMPASGIEREGTVNGIPNELEKGREGIMIACEILPDPALLRNPRKERRRMDLFIRYPSEESVFLLSPAHFFLFLFFFLIPFSLLALCLPFAL